MTWLNYLVNRGDGNEMLCPAELHLRLRPSRLAKLSIKRVSSIIRSILTNWFKFKACLNWFRIHQPLSYTCHFRQITSSPKLYGGGGGGWGGGDARIQKVFC